MNSPILKLITFWDRDLLRQLAILPVRALDQLPFGVIGFDREERISVYNATEARLAGLDGQDVIGNRMFEMVAPCMNNFMIAERLRLALSDNTSLDTTVDYVLTLRMRPTRCELRLLAAPAIPTRYILVNRKA